MADRKRVLAAGYAVFAIDHWVPRPADLPDEAAHRDPPQLRAEEDTARPGPDDEIVPF
jgi:hypothetical protein